LEKRERKPKELQIPECNREEKNAELADNSLVTVAVQLLAQSRNQDKLHLLLNDNDIDDCVKLDVCRYCISERLEVNGAIVGDTLYNIIKRNTRKNSETGVPTAPIDISDKAKTNWKSYWEYSVIVARLMGCEPAVQDDNSFCVKGGKTKIVFDPELEIFDIHQLDNTSFGEKITSLGPVIDKLQEKHII